MIFIEGDKANLDRDTRKKINQYNVKYVEKRSAFTMVKEMPNLLQKWLKSFRTVEGAKRNAWSVIQLVMALGYLISPIDLIPEIIFGIFGYIDDIAVVGTVLTNISQRFLRSYTESH